MLLPHEVSKHSQLGLVLEIYKQDDTAHFQHNLQVNPETFDRILRQICDSHVFLNNSYVDQLPVAYQLAITLFHFGHFGSAISVESVTQWAGCSAGMVVKCT